jgi:hypothetical protein
MVLGSTFGSLPLPWHLSNTCYIYSVYTLIFLNIFHVILQSSSPFSNGGHTLFPFNSLSPILSLKCHNWVPTMILSCPPSAQELGLTEIFQVQEMDVTLTVKDLSQKGSNLDFVLIGLSSTLNTTNQTFTIGGLDTEPNVLQNSNRSPNKVLEPSMEFCRSLHG